MLAAITDQSTVVKAAFKGYSRVLPEDRGCQQQSVVAAIPHSSPACLPRSGLLQV